MKLTAIGVTSGIGSMLVGAKLAGFKVLGNYEWRRYYHFKDVNGRNGFIEYFDAPMMCEWPKATEAEKSIAKKVDLVMGHPECGLYSALSFPQYGTRIPNSASDIPLFVETVAQIRPRYFVMDDLPKSFHAYPLSKYVELLPGYDLFPEWISNWGYGNIQKYRDRMMIVGALKTERFVVVPGEKIHDLKVKDVIGGIPINTPNHGIPHTTKAYCSKATGMKSPGSNHSWAELVRWFKDREKRLGRPCTSNFNYYKSNGVLANRISFCPDAWDHTAHTLIGNNPILHPKTFLPYSIRERARIQGFPDDFIFYSEKINSDGTWQHDQNVPLVKQTGKAMPIQWCEFISRQIRANIEGKKFHCSGQRIIRPNPYVDAQKLWFCENVGYANQRGACEACWMKHTCHMSKVR